MRYSNELTLIAKRLNNKYFKNPTKKLYYNELKNTDVYISDRLNSVVGYCKVYYDTGEIIIVISEMFYNKVSKKRVMLTLKHELIHAYQQQRFNKMNHDKFFKDTLKMIGGTYKDNPEHPFKYIVKCNRCNKEEYRHFKPMIKKCKKCKSENIKIRELPM
jgi:predicted Zn-ribbon and HTH transcriptional regulator